MKKFGSLLAVAILAVAAIADAGVVVDEQQVIDQLSGHKVTRARTVMIEGDKQKSIIENGNRNVILYLGKVSMMTLEARHKTYAEITFTQQVGRMGK